MLSEGRAMFPQLFKRENEEIFQRPKKPLENGKEDHCLYFHKMIGTFLTNATEKYTLRVLVFSRQFIRSWIIKSEKAK